MTTQVAVTARAEGTNRAALPAGHIPAVVYGPKQDPISISVEEKTFDKIRKVAADRDKITLAAQQEAAALEAAEMQTFEAPEAIEAPETPEETQEVANG